MTRPKDEERDMMTTMKRNEMKHCGCEVALNVFYLSPGAG